jgi:hypothetical protein
VDLARRYCHSGHPCRGHLPQSRPMMDAHRIVSTVPGREPTNYRELRDRAGADSRPAVGTTAVDDIRRVAYEIVLRACGFGSLTIFCIMIGLSFNPRLVPIRGFLTTVMTLILASRPTRRAGSPTAARRCGLLPKDARPPAGSRNRSRRPSCARSI